MQRYASLLAATCLCMTITGAPTLAADINRPVTVVTHIDLIPQTLSTGLPILKQFVSDSKRDPGVLAFIMITWTPANNHLQLLEVYDSIASFNAHVSAPHTVTFRTEFQPFIGSPIEERRYRAFSPDGRDYAAE